MGHSSSLRYFFSILQHSYIFMTNDCEKLTIWFVSGSGIRTYDLWSTTTRPLASALDQLSCFNGSHNLLKQNPIRVYPGHSHFPNDLPHTNLRTQSLTNFFFFFFFACLFIVRLCSCFKSEPFEESPYLQLLNLLPLSISFHSLCLV